MRLQPPDQLSITLIWIAAIFIAFKEGVERWPAAREALPGMSTGWLNFVPLGLLVFAAIVTMVRSGAQSASAQGRQVPAEPYGPAPRGPAPPPSVGRSLQPTQPVPKDGRTFLASNADPFSLMAICENKTSVHAGRAIEPYIGKWIRYRGIVRNVFMYSNDEEMMIMFETRDLKEIEAWFSKDTSVADVLHQGDEIEIIGKIAIVRSMSLRLSDCEVTDR